MKKTSLHLTLGRTWPAVVLISFVISGCSFFATEVRYETRTKHYTVSPDAAAEVYALPANTGRSYSVGPHDTLTSHYSVGRNGDAEEYSEAAHRGESYSVGPHDTLTAHYILKEGPYDAAQAPPQYSRTASVQGQGAGSAGRPEGAESTTIVIEASDVLFDFDKYTIKKIYYPILDEWVLFFRENPHITAQIYGHTDSIGTEAYNQKLSERRARAVFNYLVDKGEIDSSRLKTRGFGENLPVAPNTTPEGRQKNRRVEVNF